MMVAAAGGLVCIANWVVYMPRPQAIAGESGQRNDGLDWTRLMSAN